MNVQSYLFLGLDIYELIDAFLKERTITTPLHMTNVNVEGDKICRPLRQRGER
jgi:hypothetical protein